MAEATVSATSGTHSASEVAINNKGTPAADNKEQQTIPLPSFLASVDQMVATMNTMMESYAEYANTNNVSTMAISNAETLQAVADLNNVSQQMEQAQEQEEKEQKWGWIGDAFSSVISVALCVVDPALGISMLAGNTFNLSGLMKDMVGWISEGIQDVFPDLTSSDCKFLADVLIVATIITAAVVLGVLTAGAGDAAIASAVGEEVVEEGATELVDFAAKEAEGAIQGAVEGAVDGAIDGALDTVADEATDAATKGADDAAKRLSSNRAKRGVKFATLLGSQAIMGTNIAPNAVAALASNVSSNPDSEGWKIAEAVAFGLEMLLCIGASLGAGILIDAPSAFGDKFGGNSWITKLRRVSSGIAIGAGFAESFTDGASAYNASKASYDYAKMSGEMEELSLYKIDAEMTTSTNDFVQKGVEEMEKSLYDHNFASFADGAGTVSQQIA